MAAACGLSDADIDVLATFLGHDKSTHLKYYRLPEDTFQKAKVGNFLLNVMANAQKSIGVKANNTIEDTFETHTEPSNSTSINPIVTVNIQENTDEANNTAVTNNVKPKNNKLSKPRKRWDNKQTEIIRLSMENNFLLKTLPGKLECEKRIKNIARSFIIENGKTLNTM